ncbi:hypothetical protein [Streptomyces sp. NPDC048639]|uniref:hypothetical protein n=1 Tax=Streptomyces sp. NPDC048639 TaxID=3365581 RepID=UPI00371CB913
MNQPPNGEAVRGSGTSERMKRRGVDVAVRAGDARKDGGAPEPWGRPLGGAGSAARHRGVMALDITVAGGSPATGVNGRDVSAS